LEHPSVEEIVAEEIDVDEAASEPRSFEELLVQNAREHGGLPEPVPDLDEGPSGAEQDTTEGSEEGGQKSRKSESPPTSRVSSRRPGIDVILKDLDESWPEAAEVVRGMQSETNRVINEWKDMRGQMVDVMTSLQNQPRVAPTKEEVEEQKPDEFEPSEAQVKLIERAAARLGLVRKSDLDAEAEEKATDSYVQNALVEGVKTYGDVFGTISGDGSVVLHPDVRAKMQPVMERLEKRGVTPLDLAILAGIVTPKEAEEVRGEEPPAKRRVSSSVARRSVGAGPSVPKIRAGTSDEDPSDVLDRAWALARRQLSQRRR